MVYEYKTYYFQLVQNCMMASLSLVNITQVTSIAAHQMDHSSQMMAHIVYDMCFCFKPPRQVLCSYMLVAFCICADTKLLAAIEGSSGEKNPRVSHKHISPRIQTICNAPFRDDLNKCLRVRDPSS